MYYNLGSASLTDLLTCRFILNITVTVIEHDSTTSTMIAVYMMTASRVLSKSSSSEASMSFIRKPRTDAKWLMYAVSFLNHQMLMSKRRESAMLVQRAG